MNKKVLYSDMDGVQEYLILQTGYMMKSFVCILRVMWRSRQ